MTIPETTRVVLDALRSVVDEHADFFAGLGVPTLGEAIDAAITTLVDDVALGRYCRIAASSGADAVAEVVAIVVAEKLMAIMAGDGPSYFEDDTGQPFLRTPASDQLVTEDLVRHFLWIFTITTNPLAARRLLAAAPAAIRADAIAQVEALSTEAGS
jgi:hypothetical protein